MNTAVVSRIDSKAQGWVEQAVEAVTEGPGVCIIEGVLDPCALERYRKKIYAVQKAVRQEIGFERLEKLGELEVLRLMMKYEPCFYELLEVPELLQVLDRTVGNTAILHTQNGIVVPPPPERNGPRFHRTLHMDFSRVMNGFLASINCFFALSDFTEENGGTLFVPFSQQSGEWPTEEPIAMECPAGSMFVFDSTLWHSAGENQTDSDRIGVNNQFTKSFCKPQIDFVRALGEEAILALPDRTQQLLGYYTRVPSSLDEYYQPRDKRLYRSGQG